MVNKANQTHLKNTTIDSRSIVNHLDSIIIHLVKIIEVEQKYTRDEAKQHVKKILLNKANELLTVGEISNRDAGTIMNLYKKHVIAGDVTPLIHIMYKMLTQTGLLE